MTARLQKNDICGKLLALSHRQPTRGAAVNKLSLLLMLMLAIPAAACAPREVPVEVRIANALPAVNVVATTETDPVGTAAADAADDPAIWRNAADPAASLIVGTDKKAGLHVYTLDGKSRYFSNAGLVNNVDLIDTGAGIFVIASDRNDPRNSALALFALNPATMALTSLGKVPTGPGEAYGVCIDRMMVFAAIKDGSVRQIAVNLLGDAPTATIVRTMKLNSQIEGCVVDPVSRSLFVGEEDVGIWRFSADVGGPATGALVAVAESKQLVADVEGLALVQTSGRSLLIASSQGDNAYVVFGVPEDATAPLSMLGRFRIAAGGYGATSETDGIELMLGDFGADYPEGLFVAQDGDWSAGAKSGWRWDCNGRVAPSAPSGHRRGECRRPSACFPTMPPPSIRRLWRRWRGRTMSIPLMTAMLCR
jgi:3-phytase